MREEAESTRTGPLHEARKALWKKALKEGSVSREEMAEAVGGNQQELAVLALCLKSAGVRLTEAPEARATGAEP